MLIQAPRRGGRTALVLAIAQAIHNGEAAQAYVLTRHLVRVAREHYALQEGR